MSIDRQFNDKSIMIIEDKQASDYERIQYQNDLSSLYSSQKQAYNFSNIGSKNSDGYIDSMLNNKNSAFNKNQSKKNSTNISYHRSSTNTAFQNENKTNNKSETEILDMIRNSSKKNIWNQISDNILTPYAPKFQGLYDNTKFIPDELLKTGEEDNENTPHSEEKEINWEESDYDSDNGDLLDTKHHHHHPPPSLVTSPLLKKKKQDSNNTILQRAQLQEPFLHSKLIKYITETPYDQTKRKSEHSPRRLKQFINKSLYQKVNFAETSKTDQLLGCQKNFMRKVRFELLPPSIKEQLSHQPLESSSSPYQIISNKQKTNKIHLDKVLVIMENHDVQALQRIYIPSLNHKSSSNQGTRKRIYSATACQPSRELNKKLLILKEHSTNFQNDQDIAIPIHIISKEDKNEFQRFIRRRSCCCEDCGGVNKKLEKVKDIILEKDIAVASKQLKKSPDTKYSNLTSPNSSKSNKSVEQRFQRKKISNGKFTIIQGDIQKSTNSSKNESQTKIPSLNNSQTNIAPNEQKIQLHKLDSQKDQNQEDVSPVKKRLPQRGETFIGFNLLQKAPSFKQIRQEREIKVWNKFEEKLTTFDSQSLHQKEEKNQKISEQLEIEKAQQGSHLNSQNKVNLNQINEGDELSRDLKQNIFYFAGGEFDSNSSILQIQYDDIQLQNKQENKKLNSLKRKDEKVQLSVLNKIRSKTEQKIQERSKSVQTMRVIKRIESTYDELSIDEQQQRLNNEKLKQRTTESFNNFIIRQQLPSLLKSSTEERSSFPLIFHKETLQSKNHKILNHTSLQNKNHGYLFTNKFDIIHEVLTKNPQQKIQKKKSGEKFIEYQVPSEIVSKSKQQIITEQYQQLFENTKKLINTSQKRQSTDLVRYRRSISTNQVLSHSEKSPPNYLNQNIPNNHLDLASFPERQKSRSNKTRVLKHKILKENIIALKNVYPV